MSIGGFDGAVGFSQIGGLGTSGSEFGCDWGAEGEEAAGGSEGSEGGCVVSTP